MNSLPIKKKRGRKPKNIENNNTVESEEKTDIQIIVPKKRGRKPKIKDPNEEPAVKKTPGKRGRKPKEKPAEDIVKIPKRRGRKPKDKVYNNVTINKKMLLMIIL